MTNKTDLIKDDDILKRYIQSLSKEQIEQHLLDYLQDAIEWDVDNVITIVENQLKQSLESVYEETLKEAAQ
tara:strand:+ start:584 stop:796 length:213 start_codon:yes stop_codon:yes gene_type:complete